MAVLHICCFLALLIWSYLPLWLCCYSSGKSQWNLYLCFQKKIIGLNFGQSLLPVVSEWVADWDSLSLMWSHKLESWSKMTSILLGRQTLIWLTPLLPTPSWHRGRTAFGENWSCVGWFCCSYPIAKRLQTPLGVHGIKKKTNNLHKV